MSHAKKEVRPTLETVRRDMAEFVRVQHHIAVALRYRVSLDDTALPAFAVLRFASRRKAVTLAGCYYLGHDCGRGETPSPLDWATRTALTLHCRGLLGAAEAELAAEHLAGVTVWQCECRTPMRSLRRLQELLNSPHRIRPAVQIRTVQEGQPSS